MTKLERNFILKHKHREVPLGDIEVKAASIIFHSVVGSYLV
jgi:hypothetical protein